MRVNSFNQGSRELAFGLVFLVIALTGLGWLLSRAVDPAPPNQFTITTGSESGAYFAFGKRYSEILARSGIKLNVVVSDGSTANLERLRDPLSTIEAGLVQGGTSEQKGDPRLLSLGRMFLEPIWFFYRGSRDIDTLTALKGLKVSVGAKGSGTYNVALKLLGKSGITPQNTTILTLPVKDAASAVRTGVVDAIFLVLAPDAPIISDLLKAPDLHLLDFSHAEAYTRLFPFLRTVTLPKGTVDIENNIPSRDIRMVANEAALVVKATLHPALIGLTAQAASEVHGDGGMFHQIGEFPRATDPEFKVSDDAARFYKHGPPFLQRFLPFWAANLVERTAILILPLATILYPLFKGVPFLYQWRNRRRMLRHFSALKLLERAVAADPQGANRAAQFDELDRIDEAVKQMSVPVDYSDQYFDLRAAIDMVRQRLRSLA